MQRLLNRIFSYFDIDRQIERDFTKLFVDRYFFIIFCYTESKISVSQDYQQFCNVYAHLCTICLTILGFQKIEKWLSDTCTIDRY